MKRAVVLTALMVLGLSLVGSVQATPIVGLKFIGWDSGKAQTRTIMGHNGVVTGMYDFEIDTDGNGTYETDFSGFCVDPWGTIGIGQSWQANWYWPGDIMNYNGHLYRTDYGRPGGSGATRILQNYRMIGWIYGMYLPDPANYPNPEDRRHAYAVFHEALMLTAWYTGEWAEFTFPSGSGDWSFNGVTWTRDDGVKSIIEAAIAAEAYDSGLPPFTYTPMDGYHGRQEIINPSVTPDISTTTVPEPGTLLLLGSGLAGFSGLRFLRRKQKAT